MPGQKDTVKRNRGQDKCPGII